MNDRILQNQLADSFKKFKDNIAIECGDIRVNYWELDNQSAHVARNLMEKRFPKEAYVGILAEDRFRFIAGLIGILKAGCAVVPLDTVNPDGRLEKMIHSTGLRVILMDRESYNAYSRREFILERDIDVIIIEDLLEKQAAPVSGSHFEPASGYAPGDRIYVYFTSGSTGEPKGVVGKNESLLHYCKWEIEAFKIDGRFRVAQTAAVGFDAFLKECFVTFLSGATLCLPESRQVLMDPDALRRWLDTSGLHLLHCVPAIFRLLNSRKLTASHFSNLKYILLSGEPIFPAELKGWYDIFDERIQLVNLYGLTETTILSSFYLMGKADVKRKRMPIGKPISGTRMIVLNKNKKICKKGIVGEIYIRTPYHTHGYLNAPLLNGEKFITNPFTGDPRDLIFRTGDLGRLLLDGNLEVLGRMDDQVKIRGIRIQLSEIGNILMGHPLVTEAAVTKLSAADSNELLCAYITGCKSGEERGAPEVLQLRDYLRESLPEYMIPAHIIAVQEMPRTASGKIDYAQLPDPLEKVEKEFLAPRSLLEEKILYLWSEVLGMDVEKIGVNTPFFQLGGNSLNIMSLITKIHKEFDIRVPLGDIFNNPTIEKQASLIGEAQKEKHISLKKADVKDVYPLSQSQNRLYILYRMEPASIAYNMYNAMMLEGEIEANRLEEVFGKLIRRHESLRTSFVMVDEQPVQKIHKNVEFGIRCKNHVEGGLGEGEGRRDLPEEAIIPIIDNFVRPFDLSRAPLLRVEMRRLAEGKHLLMVDMHHIISDGVSQGILIQDFMSYFMGRELPELRFQYKDFSEWRNSDAQKEQVKLQEQYWLNTFARRAPLINLPTDYARPAVKSFEGDSIRFEIGDGERRALNRLAREEGVTFFILLLAVFNLLLSKLTGQDDLVIGTPVAGRRHVDLENIIGMFVNTLVTRNYPRAGMEFIEFLREVKKVVLDAFENQDYPFEELVERLELDRDVSRNPLFDVMFVMQNMEAPEVEKPGLIMRPIGPGKGESKFDLTLQVLEVENKLGFTLDYCSRLFKKETIEAFISYFRRVVSAVISEPGKKIGEISLVTVEEKERLIYELNDTGTSRLNRSIHSLFEEQAEKTPHHIAVASNPAGPGESRYTLTYEALNNKVNQLARQLMQKGVGPDAIVALMTERSLETVVGMLAVLKAGGAFLPLDIHHPEDRKRFILADSSASALLTREQLLLEHKDLLAGLPLKGTLLLEELGDEAGTVPNPPSTGTPDDRAYIIYTSGTTGNPKGVLMRHRGIVNYISWAVKTYVANEPVSFPFYTSPAFDLTLTSVFVPLVSGNGVEVYCEGEQGSDQVLLGRIIADNRVEAIKLTPSHLRLLRQEPLDIEGRLKQLIVGGEELETALAAEIYDKGEGRIKIHNEYGPTETAVGSMLHTYEPMESGGRTVPIGVPINNTQIYILDDLLMPLPVGVAGEIYIAGEGLAPGYLNRQELTAERFLPNPFRPEERMYRTGDLARRLRGGAVEFMGRLDNQVKVRGYRVELGEIEAIMAGRDDVDEVVVLLKSDSSMGDHDGNDGDRYLCAFYTSNDAPSVSDLRAYLADRLPAYMIPANFVHMEKIPVTANGKVDRDALSARDTGWDPGVEYSVPDSDIEVAIAGVWEEVLQVERVGVHDNFFHIGGNSLSIINVNTRLKKVFDRDIPITDMFRYPTVSSLAECLDREKSEWGIVSADKRIDEAVNVLDEATDLLFADEVE